MQINKVDFIKALQITGMMGYKEGFETCLMLIENFSDVPNCDINLIIKFLKNTYNKTLKESETDITEDEMKFLGELLNKEELEEVFDIC